MSEQNAPVHFYSETIAFKIQNEDHVIQWILSTFKNEGKEEIEQINIIFCSDEYLLEKNKKFLNHDYFTDILTFSISDDPIESDIFISIDRVKENAQKLEIPFQKELHRVIIHGILHLVGYDDTTPSQKEIMRKKEDYYLSQLK